MSLYYIKCISISSKFLLTSRTLITFNKINKDLYYKMHVLVLIVFASLLASTAHAGSVPYGPSALAGSVPYGPAGCRGKLIVEPEFKRGDIE